MNQIKSSHRSNIFFFILLLLLVLSVGTSGYMVIEGWEFVDSFFMTIITISTVGFREIHDLSTAGKFFTAFLIISSFGTFAYAITSLTSYLIGGKYKRYIKEKKTMKEFEKLNNHVIICGFGRVGIQVAEDLCAHGTKFVIIEMSEEVVTDNEDRPGYLFLKGDSTVDANLVKAGIDKAKAVITCLPKDSDNLYVVLSASEINKKLCIISRASNQPTVHKLKIAGAQNVIMPDAVGGSHMASLISNPDVMEFLDIIRVQGFSGANIESIAFNELPSQFRNKTIGQLEAKRLTGVTIIGFKTPEGEYIINPDFDIEVIPKSKLFVLGNPDQIEALNKLFSLEH
jgi:voltage-gated potassium channel